MSRHSLKRLKLASFICIALWMIIQIWAVATFWNAEQIADAGNYHRWAAESFNSCGWYPNPDQIESEYYIANPGYVNFLILNLRLFGSLQFVTIENILFNCFILLSLFILCRRLAGEASGYWAVIIYCILPSSSIGVVGHMTEFPALALLLAAFVLCRKKATSLFAAGVIFFLSEWFRPAAILYIPTLIGMALIYKAKPKYWVSFILGVAVSASIVGTLNYQVHGRFMIGSSTKGYNMIMGCNDDANGNYDWRIFEDGNLADEISKRDYDALQRDSAYTSESIKWIAANPGKFLQKIPKKVYFLWRNDNYALSAVGVNGNIRNSYIFFVPYAVVILLMFSGLYMKRRQLAGKAGLIFLPVLLGTAMHTLMYGSSRYHALLMPPVIYFASLALAKIFAKRHSSPGNF